MSIKEALQKNHFLRSALPYAMAMMAAAVLFVGIAHAATEPVISSINATSTDTGATITWTTDEGATAQVLYGTSTPYSASSTFNANYATNQSVTLSGLTPSTTYHYAVVSGDSSGNVNSSTDQTFMTASSSATSTVNPSVTLNPTSGMAGSSFTLSGSGFSPSEMINLSVNGATSSASADANGNFTTTLTVPSGTSENIWVSATGVSSGDTAGTWFDVQQSSSTVASSTDLTTLQNEITELQNLIATLTSELQTFLSNPSGNGTVTGSNGSYPSSTLAATIDAVGPINAGTSVDFTGRNWGTNEQVQVSNNGNVVTTAQADGGGNFSTGSLPVPANASGTETYTFTGLSTGLTRSVNVTILP